MPFSIAVCRFQYRIFSPGSISQFIDLPVSSYPGFRYLFSIPIIHPMALFHTVQQRAIPAVRPVRSSFGIFASLLIQANTDLHWTAVRCSGLSRKFSTFSQYLHPERTLRDLTDSCWRPGMSTNQPQVIWSWVHQGEEERAYGPRAIVSVVMTGFTIHKQLCSSR